MKQSLRSNENFFDAANNVLKINESKFENQSCDLPPPPPHILALSNQFDSSFRTESPYLMPPPPPSLVNVDTKSYNIDSSNDSIVPPPMPIIIPPPRQSSALSNPKSISQTVSTFCPAIKSNINSGQNSLFVNTNAANPNSISSKTSKISPPIIVPPRISSIVSANSKPLTSSIDQNSVNLGPSFKNKSLPPLQLTNKGSISTVNSSLNSVSSEISGLSSTGSKEITYCSVCGQTHEHSLSHIYSYQEQVDSELLCQICHQPLVEPLETKCGHTFCTACLKSHLVVQALCPEDKQIINYLECSPASNIVKRLLDKLLIICPNSDGCGDVLPRAELEAHLLYWCRAISSHCNNSNIGSSFHVTRNQINNVKWDNNFDKSPHTTSTTVTISSTNSGHTNDASGSSNLNNACEETLAISSSSSDSNNKSGNRIQGAACSNHPKNTVRFDPVPQTRKKNSSSNDDSEVLTENLLNLIIDRSCNSDLGISFVGGSDTPLQCVIIQEIYLDGAVAKDSRLRPGDQIISVNDIDLNQVTHIQAKHAFLQAQQHSGVCRLLVYRERSDESLLTEKEDILQFCLSKRAEKKLGIKLVGQKNKPGLYVLDLVKGSEADLDGRLRKNDRILSINGVDLKMATQDIAARVINGAEDEVRITVSRIIRPQTPDLIRTTASDQVLENFESISPTNNFSPPPGSGPIRKSSGGWSSSEKVVTVQKNYGESLGMSVAGGVNSQRGDTPIYVTNLAHEGVLARTQKVNKGDILIAVNDTELLGLSHEKAVEALKAAGQKCRKVTVRLLQGPETSKPDGPNFLPSWIYWLQLPRYCEISRAITLKRDSVTGSLGFSIVGGIDCGQQTSVRYGPVGYGRAILHQPIVVKSIVAGSVAHRNGRLKCGDILLKVNNTPLINVSHDDAVGLFKNVQDEVTLQVVSWPGTIV